MASKSVLNVGLDMDDKALKKDLAWDVMVQQ